MCLCRDNYLGCACRRKFGATVDQTLALAAQLRIVAPGAAVDLQEALHRVTMARYLATQTHTEARCINPFPCPARLQPSRRPSK